MAEAEAAKSEAVVPQKTYPKLKKAPAYRFFAYILMVVSWGQIYIGMQTVAIYAPQIMSELGVNNTTLSMIQNGVTLALGIMCFVSGMVGAKIGGKRTIVLGASIMAFSGLLYFTAPTNAAFLIFIRILEGCGAGLINAYAVSLCSAWFPVKERSFAAGLQMGLYGVVVSSTVFFVNMFNSMGLTWYEGIGTFVTVAGLVCALLVGIFYKDINKQYGVYVIDDAIESTEEEKAKQEADAKAKNTAIMAGFHKPASYREFFKSPIAWLMFLLIFCASGNSYNMQFLFPLIVPDMGYTAEEVTGFLAVAMTGSIIFGPLGGLISDRIFKGKRASTLAISFSLCVLLLALFLVAVAGHAPILVVTAAAFLAYGFAFMARGPMWALPTQIFEPSFFVQANGFLLFASNLGGVINGLLAGALADATGSYAPGVICTILFAVVAVVVALTLMKKYHA